MVVVPSTSGERTMIFFVIVFMVCELGFVRIKGISGCCLESIKVTAWKMFVC